jgi:hypothetical protein
MEIASNFIKTILNSWVRHSRKICIWKRLYMLTSWQLSNELHQPTSQWTEEKYPSSPSQISINIIAGIRQSKSLYISVIFIKTVHHPKWSFTVLYIYKLKNILAYELIISIENQLNFILATKVKSCIYIIISNSLLF